MYRSCSFFSHEQLRSIRSSSTFKDNIAALSIAYTHILCRTQHCVTHMHFVTTHKNCQRFHMQTDCSQKCLRSCHETETFYLLSDHLHIIINHFIHVNRKEKNLLLIKILSHLSTYQPQEQLNTIVIFCPYCWQQENVQAA